MNAPDQKLVLPKQFDNVTKRGIRRDPKGFVTTLLGIEADEFEVIETEQLSMKTHLADSFIRITTGNEQAIVHCEFQTHDSRDAPMPFRMAGYMGSAKKKTQKFIHGMAERGLRLLWEFFYSWFFYS